MSSVDGNRLFMTSDELMASTFGFGHVQLWEVTSGDGGVIVEDKCLDVLTEQQLILVVHFYCESGTDDMSLILIGG